MGADLPLSGLPGPTRERGPPFRQAVRLAERSPARSGRRAAYALRLIVSCDEIDSLLKRRRRSSCRGMSRRAASSDGQRAICPASPSLLDEDHPMRIQNHGLLMYDRMDVAEAADQSISTGESRKEQRPSGAEVPDETIARAGWSS
jgi:hypothetical protein